MFYIQQESEHDCLFTCIKILLANLNKDSNYLYLASPFNLKENVSLLKGKEEAKKYHLTLGAYKVEDKDNLSNKDKLPFIAVIEDNKRKHAIVVYKVTNKNVYSIDPAIGKRKIDFDTFTEFWTGEMLSYEDHEKYECPINRSELSNSSASFELIFDRTDLILISSTNSGSGFCSTKSIIHDDNALVQCR